MNERLPVRGFIFDLDGTLLDTLEDLRDSINHVLAGQGFPERSLADVCYMVGDGLRLTVARGARLDAREDEPEVAARIDLMLAEMMEYYARNWHVKTRPYPGISETLAALVRRGVPLGVLSNKAHVFTVEMIRRYFPDVSFCKVLGVRECGVSKPNPAGAFEIAAAMGLEPEHIAFVGDTRTDMKTAANAGMFQVGVTWGFRPRAELIEYGARAIVDKADELLNICGV